MHIHSHPDSCSPASFHTSEPPFDEAPGVRVVGRNPSVLDLVLRWCPMPPMRLADGASLLVCPSFATRLAERL